MKESGAALAILAAALLGTASAKPVDYSPFEGAYSGHETFHYPALGLEGRGVAVLKMTAAPRGAVLDFHRSLHAGGVNFPFTERTRMSATREFVSTITVPNFAKFSRARGRVHVAGRTIRFVAKYAMHGTQTSLVEDAEITVRGRKLVYRVKVGFATPQGLQRVATFVFAGSRS